MINKESKNGFPSQAVSDLEKSTIEHGLQVGKAIESEWFKRDSGSQKYYTMNENFHKLRLYARGEQSIQKYKDELSINGDLSYLNLDWKPVPIIPKFVDIVVNGIAERTYEIKSYAQDPAALSERTQYVEGVLDDMRLQTFKQAVLDNQNINTFNNSPQSLPESDEELSLHMQLDYKQSIEIAQEEALNNLFDLNKWDLIKKRLDYDIAVLGIAAVKTSFNTAEGVKIDYVDPSDLVYSYTESPYFDDLYYVGEIRRVNISELKKQFPNMSSDFVKRIEGLGESKKIHSRAYGAKEKYSGSVDVLYYEYKTFNHQAYKIKNTATGAQKSIQKDGDFNPGENENFEVAVRAIEVLYSGVKIVGLDDDILEWKLAENMTRPKSDITKVHMSYSIVAPRLYKGRIESLVGRMSTFADMIQLTHLKLQQVLSRMVPDGVYLDADGMAEIDLGNGTNYNPQEALNMYFQTGSVIGRSMTQEGDFNNGKIPIQELNSGSGNAKIASLIQSYNYYLQMMRDVTGLNEARDGSTPDKNALVGVQKLAAANSNTATRHILQSGLYLTLQTAECLSLRISDILEFSKTRDSFINSLGKFNIGTLSEVSQLHLHDFGIFLELAPDEEEKQMLENNIQMALQKEQVLLEDAIDIREIRNLKLANQLLKLRRRKKQELDRQMQMENIQAQTESNAQAAQASAQAEIHKQQGIAQSEVQINQAQLEFDIKKMETEAMIKKELMNHEFQLNSQIKQMELNIINEKDKFKEDRKDKRTKIQATQQSEMIDQRKKDTPPKNFESSGFDNLGGFGLEQFEPR
tara:strand:- start:4597 stop:7008 length:2412 start_codon:yes stop_codon:yes gene_type:complete